MSNVELSGFDELEKKLKNMATGKVVQTEKKALKAGAVVVSKEISSKWQPFVGTKYSKGYTIDEMKISPVKVSANGFEVKVYWRGPHERYRIIHLNEYGYTRDGKEYEPRALGLIDQSIKETEDTVINTIETEVMRAIHEEFN